MSDLRALLPALAGSPLTALKVGTLIDGSGGPPRHHVTVLIKGDRIQSVGAEPAPVEARVIDLSDRTLLPGFIDAHVHLASRTFRDGDWEHAGLTMSAAERALLGAAHARLIVRTLLEAIVERVDRIIVLEAKQHVEHEASYDRANGYDSLRVAFQGL